MESEDQQPVQAPEYRSFEGRQRDEFLNHRGNFTPDERALFQQLCTMWEPLISYDRFLRRASSARGEARHVLDSLLEKLHAAQLAVVLSAVDKNGELVPRDIALTSQASRRFFALTLDEFFQQARHNPDHPLPFASELAKEDIHVPEGYLIDVSASDLSSLLGTDSPDQMSIYRVSVSSGTQLIVTSARLRPFIGIAMQKLRHLIANANTLAAIARELDTSLTSLRSNVSGKEPRFWFKLTDTIISCRSRLEAQRNVPVDAEFFAAAEILHTFVNGQVTQFKRQKEAAQNRREQIDGLLQAISARDEPTIPAVEVRSLIESYRESCGDAFEEFKSEFFETALHPPPRRKLAVLQEFDDLFVHRDRLYTYFLSRIDILHQQLSRHYLDRMREHICGGRARRTSAFFSYESFVEDIEERLRHEDPYFLLMYDSPELLSEAVIHWAKLKNPNQDQNALRTLLERHFRPGTTRFFDLSVIFNLRLEDLFERAFQSLSPIRQIIYRIFGRYQVMRERYIEEGGKHDATERTWRPASPEEEHGEARTAISPSRHKSIRQEGTRRSTRSSAPYPDRESRRGATARTLSGNRTKPRRENRPGTGKETPGEEKQERRFYTRKESEDAWEEFKRRISD